MKTSPLPSFRGFSFRQCHRGAPGGSARCFGFSLIETVIAIGVLAVLLTGFLYVFAPAAAGIKRSINVQEADRLASGLEEELVTLRKGNTGTTGFDKAFEWIKDSGQANTALFVYQYRGSLNSKRGDETPAPVDDITGKVPGTDFAVFTTVRRKDDQEFLKDLPAVQGSVYLVKCTQLVFSGSELKPGTPGQIRDPKPGGKAAQNPDEYTEAVIAFAAEFHALPGKTPGFFGQPFTKFFSNAKTPVFTRNLAVRR